jgi:UPF0755 protein
MSKRSFRIALGVVLGTLLLAAGVVVYFVDEALSYPEQRHHGKGIEVEVEVQVGMNFENVAQLLSQKGVISKPRWFRLYGMHRGVANKVRPGVYILRDDWTPKQVLDKLLEGVEEKEVEVTLPEGKNMLEYIEAIANAGVADRAALEKLARDPSFLKKNGIEGDSIEGYLYPETYHFVIPTKPEKVLERLIRQHREVWNKVTSGNEKGYKELREKMKWSDRDILVMASIVEKEAVRADERARIAQVFINRLSKSSFRPHLLQTDPTIRYGCEVAQPRSAACTAWVGSTAWPYRVSDRLHRDQLDDVDNVYNSYTHEGLPPGPICNPGVRSIEAVLDPDGSDYLYFVAKEDGTHGHYFAKTAREHERNVEKYLQKTQ